MSSAAACSEIAYSERRLRIINKFYNCVLYRFWPVLYILLF